ncbi:hypothetical protein PTSG_01013 [Salpingoeca rosetta]|uniref:N-acetyltransferase domain-containing protein n=1 Tax=Salpingoeca rosetta (strain ATCC 50818 / BSB-021) TaxID=946362 RepID=F2TY51_SALR5|nr:uncharacterized protein PTSG_01013 [Salpingoeca rosetta]EGD76310.1 hypothetical protein PTSG_01013 [Salpingoeca rosetta]|eukprot:XP_004998485.1 hypothetical protein PTSG_01013 [Salpingoeca rosetta]
MAMTKECCGVERVEDVEVVLDEMLRVVHASFDAFVAPDFSEEGKANFRAHATRDEMLTRKDTHDWFVARDPITKELAAVVEVRERRHVSKFFTHPSHQRKGYGRALMQAAFELCAEHARQQRQRKQATALEQQAQSHKTDAARAATTPTTVKEADKEGQSGRLGHNEEDDCLCLSSAQVTHVTVCSSPYAVQVYSRLGFVATDEEQTEHGMRFVPMQATLEL